MNAKEIIEWLNLPQPKTYTMKVTSREKRLIKGLRIGEKNEKITNPYSKIEVELCPEAVAIYDLVIGCERSLCLNRFINDDEREDALTLFYAARDIFIRNWPREYTLLLD